MTDQGETDRELLRSRELLHAVLDYAPGFIMAIDADGNLQFINRVLPHHDKSKVIGTNWLQYLPPEQRDNLRGWFLAVLSTGAPHTYETSVAGPGGERLWLTTHMGPMRSNGRVVGVVLVAQEITELRRTQLEFAAAQRLAAVGTLAAGIAHEINTPVQFVSDNIQFLRDGMHDMLKLVDRLQAIRRVVSHEAPSAALTEALAAAAEAEADADLSFLRENVPPAFDRCVDGLGRVANIVRSVREFAHPASETMALADLNRGIETTLTIARGEFMDVAELETELGELPLVRCHLDQVNQVVLNLVVNAAHAIGDVCQSSGRKGRLTIRTRRDGQDVVISVSDTGGGIPEAIREHIFEPFFTTKEVGKGTGQGLALAWTLVTQNHGGALSYETAVGAGTTFLVRLPVAGKDPQPVRTP